MDGIVALRLCATLKRGTYYETFVSSCLFGRSRGSVFGCPEVPFGSVPSVACQKPGEDVIA